MRHLVVGGTGFIGGHLVEHLMDRGSAVRVLVRRAARPTWMPATVELVQGDLCDPASVRAAVSGVDVVYVATRLAHISRERPADTTAAQVMGSLVAACRQARVRRLVYVSSVDVYGSDLPPRPISEAYSLRPDTPHGRLQLITEAALQREARAGGVPAVILRPVPVFGPRDHHVTLPLLDAYSHQPGPVMIGGGRARVSLMYVKDLARALSSVACHPATAGRVLHVGGFSTTWRAFIASLCAELNRPTPGGGLPRSLALAADWLARHVAPRRERPLSRSISLAMSHTRLFSDAELVHLVGYQPAYDLLAAISETGAWYRGHAAPGLAVPRNISERAVAATRPG